VGDCDLKSTRNKRPALCVRVCVRERTIRLRDASPPPCCFLYNRTHKNSVAVNLFHTRLPRPPTDGRTEGKKPKKKEGKKKAETHWCHSCWRPQEVRAAGVEVTVRDLLFSCNNPIVCLLSAGRFENNN